MVSCFIVAGMLGNIKSSGTIVTSSINDVFFSPNRCTPRHDGNRLTSGIWGKIELMRE